jgi:hypothetical protein
MDIKEAYLNSCKSCWWYEGGRCYVGKCKRTPDGRSIKTADKKCKRYRNKRKALSSIIPNDKLIITSEKKT